MKAELSYLQSEKDGLLRQVSSISEELTKREASHQEKVAKLESKIETKTAEYQLIIANMSIQNETMSNSFKASFQGFIGLW